MATLHVVPRRIGPHTAIVEEKQFDAQEPEERATQVFRCLICNTIEERSHQFAHVPCENAA